MFSQLYKGVLKKLTLLKNDRGIHIRVVSSIEPVFIRLWDHLKRRNTRIARKSSLIFGTYRIFPYFIRIFNNFRPQSAQISHKKVGDFQGRYCPVDRTDSRSCLNAMD